MNVGLLDPSLEVPRSDPRRLDRLQVLGQFGPGLLMLVIALVGATRPVLSWDEIATADVASRSPGQIWRLIHHIDGVFAPYYFFEHYWTALVGSSVLALRLPSILAMAGVVVLTGVLGRRLFGPAVGTVAGLLLCVVPNTSRYADEARPYAFACLFALLALIMLLRALDRPSALRFSLYGVSVLFLGLAHVIALTTLGAHVVLALRHRRSLVPWLIAVVAAVVALAPIFWLGVHERGAQLSWIPPISLGAVWKFPAAVVGSAPVAWILLALAVIGLWQPSRSHAVAGALGLTPVVVVALVSVLVAPYFVARYLLVVLAPLALLAAAGLTRIASPAGRPWLLRVAAILALVAVGALPGEQSVRGKNAKNGSDYRTAAAIIRGQQQPGDGIVFTANSRTMRTGLDYYLRSDHAAPRDVLLSQSAAEAASLRAVEYTPTAARLAGTSRLWLLLYGVQKDPSKGRTDLQSLLASGYHRAHVWSLHRETLALYVRNT